MKLLLPLCILLLFSSFTAPQRKVVSEMTGVLGVLKSANMNSTADQAILINSSNYIIRKIIVTNPSTSLTTAVGGFYAATGKTTAIVANTQIYTALTGSTKFLDCTLAAILGTDRRTETTLYLSLTTPQGGAATADIYIIGDSISGL